MTAPGAARTRLSMAILGAAVGVIASALMVGSQTSGARSRPRSFGSAVPAARASVPPAAQAVRPRPVTTPPPLPPGPIVALGDSITYGFGQGVTLSEYGPAPARSFPWDLQRDLGIPVVNAGISGATAAEALDPAGSPGDHRPPSLRLPALLALHPRLVIVGFGTSEAVHGISIPAAAASLDTLLGILDGAHVPTVIVGTHTDCRIPGCTVPNPFTDAWDQSLRTLAARHHSGLVLDVTGGLAAIGDLYDVVHPNAAGYQIVANRVAGAVRPVLGASQ